MTKSLVTIAAATAALAGAAFPLQAQDLSWRWGMSPAEVLPTAGQGAKAVKDKKDQRIRDAHRLVTSHQAIDGIDFEVDYYFAPKSSVLTMVRFQPALENCEKARAGFVARNGAGASDRESVVIQPNLPQLVTERQEWPAAVGGKLTYLGVSFDTDLQHCQFLYES